MSEAGTPGISEPRPSPQERDRGPRSSPVLPLQVAIGFFATALLLGLIAAPFERTSKSVNPETQSTAALPHSPDGVRGGSGQPAPGAVPDGGSSTKTESEAPAQAIQLDGKAWALLLGLLVCVGIGLPVACILCLKRGHRAKVAGAALGMLSLFGAKEVTGALVKEISINPDLSLFGRRDGGGASAKPAGGCSQECGVDVTVFAGAMKAQPLGSVGPFVSGSGVAENAATDAELSSIAAKLGEAPQKRPAMLLLLGSADEQELRRAVLVQFGTNEGLAKVRAVWTMQQLISRYPRVVSPLAVMVESTGPRHTGGKTTDAERAEDREVEVWAVSAAQ